jgi:hypothetical protein
MIKADNPAGRLYLILEEAKNASANTPTVQVWAKVFGFAPEDKIKLFSYIYLINELYRETIEQINSISDINKELYLQHLPNIARVVGPTNLDTTWNSYVGSLSDVAMHSLAICSDTLSRLQMEQPIEQSSLDALRQEIEELAHTVENSDLDNIIKLVILDQLEAIRKAIWEYKLRGAKGLKEALDSSIMAMVRNHELFKKEGTKDEVKRFAKFITKFDSMVSSATKAAELCGKTAKLLGYAVGNAEQ